MKQPQFLRNADQLDKWLERFNPLRGATLGTLATYFDDAAEGRYANVMWMARKMIRRDPTIRACMRRIHAQLMQLKWSVKTMATLPSGLSAAQAETQRTHLLQRYEQIENLKQAAAASALADFFGFAHLEKHYDEQGSVVRLQPVPQWHWVREGLYGEWKFNAKASPWPRDPAAIDAADFVVREIDDPWIEIALVNGLRLNQNNRDWDGFNARYGIPSTFFIAPPGATEEKLEEFADVANDLAADGAGVLPNGTEVKMHEAAQKGETFGLKDKHHASMIVLAATGGLLTMLAESGSGTLAGGAHSDTWRDLVAGIASEVSECFQEQLDKIWLAEQFPGQKIAAYFELEFPEESADRHALATTVKTLKEAGYTVQRDWLVEESGIPLEDAAPAPPAPLKNRQQGFIGGPSSARDRAEAMQLAETAIQAALDVTRDTVAPLAPDIAALIAMAEDATASAADFIMLASKVEQLFPELMTPASVQALAASLEAALGTAAAQGARAAIRQQSAAK